MDDELPMPTPTVPVKPLTSFKSLSFDIYETLIQWENSIVEHLKPLISRYEHASTDQRVQDDMAELFAKHEKNLQAESPSMKYNEILAKAYMRVAVDIGAPKHDAEIERQAKAFGDSVGDWPAFPDTVDAMNRLSKHYKLIALSNVDRDSFARTNAGPLKGLRFWRVFTAEDIGSYKPDPRNFEYLFKHLDEDDKEEGGPGITKDENLHVAQSLFHDHKPAKKLGTSSVWINRKGAGTGRVDFKEAHDKGEFGYGWRFHTLGEFADEVERQWTARDL
ncbi:haloalkanoic acid dehalogenase [Exophiala viscosa]|uniref:Haloalkanoic acid dehalogenase n=1 Tax=Exophiala viscosa TaxID=2486360 RepID=A0AAN6E5R3_9EURO|nr:haloalkanoic acid dehalogenase [Exophiala viscosa]KAI1627702.1 haloalkanoic acid dehalogenase [Exophiala viscosa]